jgi:hypothetical protein
LFFGFAKIVFHLSEESARRTFFFREFTSFGARSLSLLTE